MIKATVEKKGDNVSAEVGVNGNLETLSYECAALLAAVLNSIDELDIMQRRLVCKAVCDEAEIYIQRGGVEYD